MDLRPENVEYFVMSRPSGNACLTIIFISRNVSSMKLFVRKSGTGKHHFILNVFLACSSVKQQISSLSC